MTENDRNNRNLQHILDRMLRKENFSQEVFEPITEQQKE